MPRRHTFRAAALFTLLLTPLMPDAHALPSLPSLRRLRFTLDVSHCHAATPCHARLRRRALALSPPLPPLMLRRAFAAMMP